MALQEGGSRFEVIGDILRREMSGTLKNPWFDNKDTAKKEDLDTLVRLSWGPAVEEMVKILGKDPTQWTWGKIHQITLSHDFLKEYDRGPIPGPGGYGTVNNAGFGLMGDRMDYGGGPSVRLVMQATKGGIKMWGTLPGADISDWKSKDAADLLDNWMKGKFFEFDNKAGRAMKDTGNKRRLTFIP